MDLIKSLGSICCSILSIVVLIACIVNDATLMGFILAGFFLFLAYKCMSSVSPETMRAVTELEKQKEYKKMNGGYKCPSCGKMAGHQIGALSKGVSVRTMGLASNKIGKTYKCANCNYMW